jgi:RsiW-degrading membrane proteinase PrsW (M82 family)
MPEECVIPIHRPKPTEMIFFFTCGIIMSVSITFFIRALLDPSLSGLAAPWPAVISLVLFAPFIEEFSKIFPLYYRHGETQRSILNLAIMVGLGFATVELLEYVLFLGTPIVYRLPGLFFHPSNAAISAYGIATKRPVPFYFLAVSLHFGANFFGLVNPLPLSLSILVVGLTVFLAYTFYGRTKEKMIAHD